MSLENIADLGFECLFKQFVDCEGRLFELVHKFDLTRSLKCGADKSTSTEIHAQIVDECRFRSRCYTAKRNYQLIND